MFQSTLESLPLKTKGLREAQTHPSPPPRAMVRILGSMQVHNIWMWLQYYGILMHGFHTMKMILLQQKVNKE